MPSLNTKLASAPNTSSNYVLKATSSTTIGNSLIFDNGTNVGIGTTSPQSTLHISGGYTGFQYNSAGTYPAYNTYFGAIGTNFSNSGSELDIWNTVGGGFAFRKQTAASTQTALMYISSTGNVGIGTTSPSQRLTIAQTNGYPVIDFNNSGTTYGDLGFQVDKMVLSSYSTTPLTFWTNGTEKMRITSGGALCVGGTGAGEKFNITSGNQKFYTYQNSAGQYTYIGTEYAQGNGNNKAEIRFGIESDTYTFLSFATAAGGGSINERMRITSGGDVYIGTTSDSGRLVSVSDATNKVAIQGRTPNGTTVPIIQASSVTTGSTSWYAFVAQSGNGSSVTANTMFVYGNGNVVNLNNSYGALSDIKLKENISDASPKLLDLMKVRIRNYNLIADETKTKQIGVIAQELEEIFPSMIQETFDRDMDGKILKTKTKEVKYSVFIPMLIKAIQEQQSIIDGLNKRLNALENK